MLWPIVTGVTSGVSQASCLLAYSYYHMCKQTRKRNYQLHVTLCKSSEESERLSFGLTLLYLWSFLQAIPNLACSREDSQQKQYWNKWVNEFILLSDCWLVVEQHNIISIIFMLLVVWFVYISFHLTTHLHQSQIEHACMFSYLSIPSLVWLDKLYPCYFIEWHSF